MKKIVTLLIAYSILNIIIESCCPDIVKTYTQISSFKTELSDREINPRDRAFRDGDTTSADTLRMYTKFEYKYIARNTFSPNSVFAFDCGEHEGENGLKVKIKEINIISDADFQGIDAGLSLNNYITCKYSIFNYDLPLDSLKSDLNRNFRSLIYGQTFYINSKPNNPVLRKFTLVLKLEDGTVLESNTPEIVWE